MLTPRIPSSVPAGRISVATDRPPKPGGSYVLYWMIANRRTRYNFSLQRAIDWAVELDRPLVIFEALRAGYRWASDRFHAFVIQGMLDNKRATKKSPVTWWPYLEPRPGQGSGALQALAAESAVVISDDFPCFFLPRMIEAVSARMPVRFELVDSNGLYPMRATERVFLRAHDFRRHLQKELPPHLSERPLENPLAGLKLPRLDGLPEKFQQRWPKADLDGFEKSLEGLSRFPIDHTVRPVFYSGGSGAARQRLDEFIDEGLERYHTDRNQPGQRVASELSPWLHFGHISSHEVFERVMACCDWTQDSLAQKATGSRSGWWGAPEPVESFLDELVTWRELGYNLCALTDDYDQYQSLPDWARQTLETHSTDPRPVVYSLEQLEQSQTYDELWNAAQRQLVREGRIHNYLRMLWGKKILEWSPTPQVALEQMIHLNNKYAVDGRNPNSCSGIFWILGRYDRAWGPERPIFGKIRYMSSDNTARKVQVKDYLRRYSASSDRSEDSLFSQESP